MWSHDASEALILLLQPLTDSSPDVAGSGTFSTDDPDLSTSGTREVHRRPEPVLDVLWLMPVVLQCWAVSTVPLLEHVPDFLSRNTHVGGLLKLIFQDPGSAPPLLHLPARRLDVLLLGCYPPTDQHQWVVATVSWSLQERDTD